MPNSEPLLGPGLIAVCVVMAVAAGLVSRFVLRGSFWPVPKAAVRAAVQLAAVATVLAAAMSRLWSSMLVLAVMFAVATFTAARRSEANHGSLWLVASLAGGILGWETEISSATTANRPAYPSADLYIRIGLNEVLSNNQYLTRVVKAVLRTIGITHQDGTVTLPFPEVTAARSYIRKLCETASKDDARRGDRLH